MEKKDSNERNQETRTKEDRELGLKRARKNDKSEERTRNAA